MISTRAVSAIAAALTSSLVIAVVVSQWFAREIGPTGLHGPVALAPALPFLIIFAVGSVALAVIVIVRRLPVGTTFIGLVPVGILVVAVIVLLVVATAAG